MAAGQPECWLVGQSREFSHLPTLFGIFALFNRRRRTLFGFRLLSIFLSLSVGVVSVVEQQPSCCLAEVAS
ncbi:hypothetical protein T12_10155 [Trichinella patagoniensis]|nr:hypothetical protein T12_10155 [Trichinella patagoniensis]